MKKLDKFRAEIEADPEAKAQWDEFARRLRPMELKTMAWIEEIFPPESPTSKRRGGNKLARPSEFVDAVCAILDARMGNDFDLPDFRESMKSADPGLFLIFADAAQYVQSMPKEVSKFADCVITARRVAAILMSENGQLPKRGKVIAAVIKYLGPAAFGEEEITRWAEVMKAAGLSDLQRSGSARTSMPKTSGVRRKKPNH